MNQPILPRAPLRRRFPSFRFLVGLHCAMDPATAGQSLQLAFRSHISPLVNSSRARIQDCPRRFCAAILWP